MGRRTKILCRRSSNHDRVSDTAANVTCTSNGEVRIIHLPTEILEEILKNISYHEISKVREVCRRFRDICNEILNRVVRKLNRRIVQHLQLLDEADAAYLKRFDPEVLRRDSEIDCERKSGTLICRRWLLYVIDVKLSPLRAVWYRFLYTKIFSCRRCFFPGKIMDEVQRILTLVRSTRLTVKDMNVDVFSDLVDTYMDFFHDRIEPTLVGTESIINSATLLGCELIDILESCVDCETDVKVSEDSQGWYHITGEYKFDNLFFTCLSSKQFEFRDLEPLTVKEQRILHECLSSIINKKNEWYLRQIQMDYRNQRSDETEELRITEGCYEGLAACDNSVIYYGYHAPTYYYGRSVEWRETDNQDDEVSGENEIYYVDGLYRIFLIDDEQDEENDSEEEEIEGSDTSTEPDLDNNPGNDQGQVNEDDVEEESDGSDSSTVSDVYNSIFSTLTIKAELKCQKVIAPIKIRAHYKNSSKEEHKHESSIEDTDHDLVLRLEICCSLAARNNNRLPSVYRCLIKQKYLQEIPLSNPATSQEELAVTPSDHNYNRADIFTVRNSLRVAKLA